MKRGYGEFIKAAKEHRKSTHKKVSTQGTAHRKSSIEGQPLNVEAEIKKIFADRALVRSKKSKSLFQYSTGQMAGIVALFIGALGTGYGFIFPDEVVQLASRFEVGFLPQTLAAEAKSKEEKSSSTKGKETAKDAVLGSKAERADEVEKSKLVSEELSHFSKLNDRKKELDRREKELAELEEELHKQKLEIDARIEKLEKIRNKISSVLQERVKVDQEKVKRLVEFYSNMKPKQAAEIVTTLNEDLAVEILGQMKKKSAADIMNLLEPAKARTLSEKFAGYQRR
ncbi:MAG: hypothetical protein KDD61_05135 [Bdellovibrionales bacterium]|nr:hypothetical protein [Bdellovibrionales bacterium]